MDNIRSKSVLKVAVLSFIFVLSVFLCGYYGSFTADAANDSSVKPIKNFHAVLDKNDNVKFTWTGNNSEGYIIYKFENNKWQRISKFKSKSGYSMPYKKINGVYKFAVRGYNTKNKREVINPDFETTTLTLYKVENIKTYQTYNKARIEWKKSSYYDAYTVYMRLAGTTSYIKMCDTYKNTYTYYDLENWTHYDFVVRGYKKISKNKLIKSDYTPVKTTTLTYSPKVDYTKSGKDLNLKWDKVKGAEYYLVYIRGVTGEWKRVGRTDSLSFKIKNPYPEENFYVTARAIGEYNNKDYISMYVATMVQPDSILNSDNTLFTCGDSVAYGNGSNSITYSNMLADIYNLKLTDVAISGSSFSTKDSLCITRTVLENVTIPYKYAIIEGGVNDYSKNMPLGSVTPQKSTDFDSTTACGGLETIFYHFRKNYPETKVYFLSIPKPNTKATVKNKLGLTYKDYLDRYMEICEKNNITVIDLFNNSELDTSKPENAEMKRIYTSSINGIWPAGDGIHPTEEGYELFYMPEILKVFKID